MNNKFIKIVFTSQIITTPIFAITSCNNNDVVDPMYYELKDTMVDYFIKWCKQPHPTFYFGPANKYLTEEIKNTLDIDVNRDDYYKAQAQQEWANEYKQYYGNIWFDVPATEGYELLPLTILQGHMDMVIDGMSMQDAVVTPIIPIVDERNNLITSKDQKTSLGADDGAGITMILALLKNKQVEHGPLRILFTADEEQGLLGAKSLGIKDNGQSIDVIGDAKYLINIDNEKVGDIVNSSGGLCSFWYTLNDDDADKNIIVWLGGANKKIVTLKCNGVRGGHSASNIVNHANALKCLLDVINEANILSKNGFHLISANTDTLVTNTIPTDVTIKFASSIESVEENINPAIDKTLAKWKDLCPDDIDISITAEYEPVTGSNKSLSDDFSKKLFSFMNWFYYGVEEWISGKENIAPASSQNIGPLTIDLSQTDIKNVLKFGSSSRSCYREKIAEFENACKNKADELLGDGHYELFASSPPFVSKGENPLIDILKDGFIKNDIEAMITDEHGGLEISYFAEIKKDLIMTSIGPTITDAHNKKEALHLETIIPTFKAIIYTLPLLK